MSGVFNDNGIQFQYPENWELERSQDDDSKLQVTLSSSNTAFWTLSVYPELRDTQALADEVLAAMRAEYPQLESDPMNEPIVGQAVAGFDLNFSYLDLTNTALVRVFHHQGDTCLVLAQAEDHDLPSAEPVFQAMLFSLLSNA